MSVSDEIVEAMAAHRLSPTPMPGRSTATSADNTALVVIDMQTDFCGAGGYVDKMGYDISLTRAPIEPIKKLLRRPRARPATGDPHARGASARPLRPAAPTSAGARSDRRRHRRPGARAAASWCAASRAGRSSPNSRRCPARPIIDKPGKGSFCATDLELMLRTPRHRNIVLTGITTDVCVHTTMREANDRGFECLLLEDCCGATNLEKPCSPRSTWSRCRAACSARSPLGRLHPEERR
jgi:nicotinamidase-related amidase